MNVAALRTALTEAAERRRSAERARSDTMYDLTQAVRMAVQAMWRHPEYGLTIKEIGELAGLSRPTVYSMIEDLR